VATAPTVGWTDLAALGRALGPSVTLPTDPAAADVANDVIRAANAWSFRKRAEAGYDDDDTPDAAAPTYDVAMGATLYAVALWRERASTDGYPSFEDLATFTPTGGSLGQIRRLLGVGRAAVDAPPADTAGSSPARRGRWPR
jgi:hypothetical protein